jgi:hypothetical protein
MKEEEEAQQPLLSMQKEKSAELGGPADSSKKEESKDFLQTLIDDANGQFISSEYRYTQRTKQTPEEMRLKLLGAAVDAALISSPGARFETALSHSPGELPSPASMQVSSSSVIRVLGGPVGVSERIDTGADEIAEIISSHTRSDRHTKTTAASSVGDGRQGEGDSNSVVAHFQSLPN